MGLRDNGRSGNGDASFQWMTRLSSFSIKEANGAVNQESNFFFFLRLQKLQYAYILMGLWDFSDRLVESGNIE